MQIHAMDRIIYAMGLFTGVPIGSIYTLVLKLA